MRATIIAMLVSLAISIPVESTNKAYFPESLIVITARQNQPQLSSVSPAYITLSQQVFNAQNRARVDPLSFSKELALYGDVEAAAICANATPIALGDLIYVGSLRSAAAMQVNEQGPLGLLGHNSPSGMTAFQRMNLFGTWHVIAGENIMYGPGNAMGVMAGLIKSPEHYANIFRSSFKVAGISCGYHSTYQNMCVIDYAGLFITKYL